MAAFHSLIFAALFFFAQGLVNQAHALVSGSFEGPYSAQGTFTDFATCKATLESRYCTNVSPVCSATYTVDPADTQATWYSATSYGGTFYKEYNGNPYSSRGWLCEGTVSCPANSALNQTTGACECSAGYEMQGGVCVQTNPCAALSGQTVTGTISASSSPSTVSFGGCTAVVVQASNQCAEAGTQKICGTWKYDGTAAEQTAPVGTTGTQQQVYDCPTGQCLGTFNSKNMCLPCGNSNQPSTSTTTTTNQDGSVTTTTTSSDGTTTSTTTSTVDSNGNPLGTPTEDNQYDKDSVGASSAACETPPTCSGDPVQCAQLQQQWQTMCQLKIDQFTAEDPLVVEGQDSFNAPMDAVSSQTIALPASFDQTGFLNGSCMADEQISVLGTTINLPFSDMCWVFESLGMVMIAVAGLISARIVGVI